MKYWHNPFLLPVIACLVFQLGCASPQDAASVPQTSGVSSEQTPSGSAAASDSPSSEEEPVTAQSLGLADGTYQAEVSLTGGSGRAGIASPAVLTVADGAMTAAIVWSSSSYDYMLVDGVQYLPTATEGGSAFEIPVAMFDAELPVVADTVAMGTPHEISYTLNFSSASVEESAA